MADIKLEHTLSHVRALFGDTSVSAEQTMARMQSVIDAAKLLVHTVEEQQEREEAELLLRE